VLLGLKATFLRGALTASRGTLVYCQAAKSWVASKLIGMNQAIKVRQSSGQTQQRGALSLSITLENLPHFKSIPKSVTVLAISARTGWRMFFASAE